MADLLVADTLWRLKDLKLNISRLAASTAFPVRCWLVITLLTTLSSCGGGSSSQTTSPPSAPPALAASQLCPESAVYCREALKVAALGFHNGLLYGWRYAQPGASCPESGLPANNSTVFCFYTTDTFSPESWTFRGQIQQMNATDPRGKALVDSPIEIQFGPDACPYKYIYTLARILRATSALTDWNFVDLVPRPHDLVSFVAELQPCLSAREAPIDCDSIPVHSGVPRPSLPS